jgi:hypothetical protein
MDPSNNNTNNPSGTYNSQIAHNVPIANPSGEAFMFGKASSSALDKKKKLKPEQVGEERMHQVFNASSNKDHDDLKRKRESYAIELRKKKK